MKLSWFVYVPWFVISLPVALYAVSYTTDDVCVYLFVPFGVWTCLLGSMRDIVIYRRPDEVH